MNFVCVTILNAEFRLWAYVGLKPSENKLDSKMFLFLQKGKIIIYSLIVSSSGHFSSASKPSERNNQLCKAGKKKITTALKKSA